MNQETTPVLGKDIGSLPDEVAARFQESGDLFERTPTYNLGQEGFQAGTTMYGRYLGTKRVFSDKFNNPKKDERGRKYRDLHEFEDLGSKKLFGIWSSGTLGAVLTRLEPGIQLGIRYDGKEEKALREGQSPAHRVTILGNGGPIRPDWSKKPVINMKEAEEISPSVLEMGEAGDGA